MARGGERPLSPPVFLPPLPDRTLLADLCREAAARERLQPQVIEKDFYLTRLLWALGQALGGGALLKGGTLLSKVDLGFKRMSEDVDLVVPTPPSREKRVNVRALNGVRDALKSTAEVVGVRLPFPDGANSSNAALTGSGRSCTSRTSGSRPSGWKPLSGL